MGTSVHPLDFNETRDLFNSLGPIADISAQFAVHTNDDSGYIRIIVEDSPFMAPVQVVERG